MRQRIPTLLIILFAASSLTASADEWKKLDANTGDGHVSIDFPVTVTGSLRENNIHGKINGGGTALELRTGDGNIEVKKI